MNFRCLAEVQNAWNAGDITIEQLVDHYLLNISTKNPEINAFLEVFNHEASWQVSRNGDRNKR
jgi:aspartyl-tRNA(Asn)/glutamyl-tRNA(Gln) amidotransferase subunit A